MSACLKHGSILTPVPLFLVLCCPCLYCLVLSCPVSSCSTISFSDQSCLPPCSVPTPYPLCPLLSLTIPYCPLLSCPVLLCPVLSCPVLLCPVLFCTVLSCYVLSCPVLSSPVLLQFNLNLSLVKNYLMTTKCICPALLLGPFREIWLPSPFETRHWLLADARRR